MATGSDYPDPQAAVSFRFQELDVWRRAVAISSPLFRVAEALDQRRFYRFAEQLRAATLSITNNIAEGSGSVSKKDFANFLNTARRSVFEVANMLLLFQAEKYITENEATTLLPELEEESRMLIAFMRKLTNA